MVKTIFLLIQSNINLIQFVAPLWTFLTKDPPICPNSYEKLTKIKLGQVGVGSNIAQNNSSS